MGFRGHVVCINDQFWAPPTTAISLSWRVSELFLGTSSPVIGTRFHPFPPLSMRFLRKCQCFFFFVFSGGVHCFNSLIAKARGTHAVAYKGRSGQFVGVSSLLPPCACQGLRWDHQVWWPLPAISLVGRFIEAQGVIPLALINRGWRRLSHDLSLSYQSD